MTDRKMNLGPACYICNEPLVANGKCKPFVRIYGYSRRFDDEEFDGPNNQLAGRLFAGHPHEPCYGFIAHPLACLGSCASEMMALISLESRGLVSTHLSSRPSLQEDDESFSEEISWPVARPVLRALSKKR